MLSKSGFKFFCGAVALAIGGTAMANTSLNATTTGDIFLNIEDTTAGTSYLVDTTLAQASFNGNGSYSFDLSGNSGLTAFLSTVTTPGTADTFDYSVLSATKAAGVSTVYVTGAISPTQDGSTPGAAGFSNNQAQAAIASFFASANAVTTSSTTSVALAPGKDWAQGLYEGVVDTQLFAGNGQPPYNDNAALNTPLAFYSLNGSTLGTFASDWDFSTSNDQLTYGTPVPLPTPVLLLLSGLGLMGAVSRRGKAKA